MQFLSVRCLNCQNLDTFPRINLDEIPYCGQCASTTNLVPEPQPLQKPPQQQQSTMPYDDDELIQLFSRNLYLTQQQPSPAAPPTPPMSASSPTCQNFSITQHYHHSSHQLHAPPSPQQSHNEDEMLDPSDPVSAQLFFEVQQQQVQQQQTKSSDREYAEYLMSSDLSSPNSINELEIALAHGIISNQEYQQSIDNYKHNAQIAEDARRHQEMMMTQQQQQQKALGENCSAMEMLSAAKRREIDPVYRTSEWFNDYYGGVDMSFVEDEEVPCSIYAGAGGCFLRPFDL
ncbi:hypothetical protein BDD12DRAFT_915792 [Trichophaea hybrida]|nr:hypothetical protein BDD12DRAFT_915792 [Trichophaea hybrida]